MSGPSGPNNKRALAAKPKKSAPAKNAKPKTTAAGAGGAVRAKDSGPSGPNNSQFGN
jgi:hypothetical protein